MIIVSENSFEKAKESAINKLLSSSGNKSDDSLLFEQKAVLEIKKPSEIRIAKHSLFYRKEKEYYCKLFSKERINKAVKFMQENIGTRRAVFTFWKESLDLKHDGESSCLVYVYFRVVDGKLDFAAHMRANDALRLLLLDFYFCHDLHSKVARRLGIRLGKHYHFVDSLHLREKNLKVGS